MGVGSIPTIIRIEVYGRGFDSLIIHIHVEKGTLELQNQCHLFKDRYEKSKIGITIRKLCVCFLMNFDFLQNAITIL